MPNPNPQDQAVIAQAVEILNRPKSRRGWGALWPFLGPAFIACIAYVDPGNFATNIEGGARFGYTLLWVIAVSNLVAMLIQSLAAKLGIATGKNLAEMCRETLPAPAVWLMWAVMELVAMATDLAEFMGAALGFYLLFGFPLWLSGVVTGLITFFLLFFERYGFRILERVITIFVGVITVCYILELAIAPVRWGGVFRGMVEFHFMPGAQLTPSLLVSAGILGATVMPHVIFLHSALLQGRIRVEDSRLQKRLLNYEWLDIVLALGLAGFVNMAMMILAAATFHDTGLVQDGKLEEAYRSLQGVLGPLARYVFGISLLAAGLSSSAVGTMSGQVIMQGFLRFHIPLWLRRGLTMAPALLVIWLGLDPTHSLVLSQVALSFGLPFAILPLVYFTSQRRIMGPLVNRKTTIAAAVGIVCLVVGLNGFLICRWVMGL